MNPVAQQLLQELALCLAHRLHVGLCVELHRRPEILVTQHPLHGLCIHFQLHERCCERVPPPCTTLGTIAGGAILIATSIHAGQNAEVTHRVWTPTGTGENCNGDICNATGEGGESAPEGGGDPGGPGDTGAGGAAPGGGGTASPGSGSPSPGGGGGLTPLVAEAFGTNVVPHAWDAWLGHRTSQRVRAVR